MPMTRLLEHAALPNLDAFTKTQRCNLCQISYILEGGKFKVARRVFTMQILYSDKKHFYWPNLVTKFVYDEEKSTKNWN